MRFRQCLASGLLSVALGGATAVMAQALPAPVSPSAEVQTSAPAVRPYLGLLVNHLTITGVQPSDAEKLRPLLLQREGEPLDPTKVQRSIQALYDTGMFDDIEVEAEKSAENSVSLSFVTTQNYFFGITFISHSPAPPPTRNQLLGATRLELGDPVTPEKLQSALDGMKQALAANGYHDPTIKLDQIRHPESSQLDNIFQIKGGRPARIGNVQVLGDPGFGKEDVLDIAHLEPGERVTSDRVTRALQRLRNKYQKEDRLEAQVSIAAKAYRAATNTEDYVVNVSRGPKVIIRVNGAKVSKRLLKKYIPVYEENSVDDDLLNEGRRNLVEYFQTEGYFDVVVVLRQENDPQTQTRYIIYDVQKGKRHKLVAIDFEGNHYFDSDLLRERLSLRTASLLEPHGIFSRALLTRDTQAIQNLYQTNGFAAVDVTAHSVDDYRGVSGHIKVNFEIEEGPQTQVAALHVVGNKVVSDQEIRRLLDSTEGQPFSEANVAQDRDSLVNYYFDHGFPKMTFEANTKQVSAAPPRVELTYDIQEGDRVLVNRVLVSGLQHTKDFVAQRELEVHPGAPLSQTDLLDSQRRLYDLGIFNQVNVAVQNPDGDFAWKNVLVQAEEAKRYTFTYGLGMEIQSGAAGGINEPQGHTGVSPRASLDVTRIDFRGRNHTIVFKSSYGRFEKLALLSYQQPYWLNKENWKLTFTTFYNTTRDVRTFTAERLEGSVQAQQRLSRSTLLFYGLLYRRVKVDPKTLAIDPNLIPLLSKPVRVGMPTFTFVRDRRDDALNAHHGSYNTVNLGFSTGALGSQADFGRFLGTNSTYHPFNHNRWVFARNTSIGILDPFANTVVPLPERFYAGGTLSLRSFALNQAGPRDLQTGFPLGGNGLFLNQFELRMPPVTLPFFRQDISPVIFHDAGNVFASVNDIFPSIFRVAQRHRDLCEMTTGTSGCDFNYFSHAVGGGLRYKTPIGPVRIDMGYNLNPPVFPIREQDRFETLRHFNLYFSIGQTF